MLIKYENTVKIEERERERKKIYPNHLLLVVIQLETMNDVSGKKKNTPDNLLQCKFTLLWELVVRNVNEK